jgi:hypothetical protein
MVQWLQGSTSVRESRPDYTRGGVFVNDLSISIASELRRRMDDPNAEWPYHPRSNELAAAVRHQLLGDLFGSSRALAAAGAAGTLVCDFNVRLETDNGRKKRIDLVLGAPEVPSAIQPAPHTILKARVGLPAAAIEIKSCMTAHSKAVPRLGDELMASAEVVRGAAPRATIGGILIINVSSTFTSPLALPGPTRHRQPFDAQSVIAKLTSRLDKARLFHAFAMCVIDFDNERKALAVDPADWVPDGYRYDAFVARFGSLDVF